MQKHGASVWLTAIGLTTLALTWSDAAHAQSTVPAIFVANNGNCEGSVTSFMVNPDGTLTFVKKVVTGTAVPCSADHPGTNPQCIDISPSGRYLVTGHGTSNEVVEQLTFFEVDKDASFNILFTATTQNSPVNVKWLSDEYIAVTAHPLGQNDFVIIYHVDFEAQSISQHYYQPVPYIFEILVDLEHNLMYTKAGSFGVQPFRINPNFTITKLTSQPINTGVYFLGAGLSPDGSKLYYGGGISSYNGLSSRWIGGFDINTATGAMTCLPNAPYLSPPSDGTSGPSPKEVDISGDGKYAFVNHGGTGHIKGFAIDKDGSLLPLENSYFDVGGQGDSGNMTVMGDLLFVPRRYSAPVSGVFSLRINPDGSLTQIGDIYPTQGSLPWDIVAWPGQAAPCVADITGDNEVNVSDLLAVIAAWGASGGAADINGNGVVGVDDLLMVVNAWGSCG